MHSKTKKLALPFAYLASREWLTWGEWEWTALRGKEGMQRGLGGTGDRMGGQGRSCDKEVIMKDVATVRP